ncbi:MAG: hypothetical protein WD709_06820 [Gammaproteobacteria bacterium]
MSVIDKDVIQPELPEAQIATILQYRYGDGLVYQPRHKSKSLYNEAVQSGFIDAEGYLTRKGRTLVARYKYL